MIVRPEPLLERIVNGIIWILCAVVVLLTFPYWIWLGYRLERQAKGR